MNKHILKLATMACLVGTSAWSHEAKTGWVYPVSCCGNGDCREVSQGTVSRDPMKGYVINATGETISYTSRKLRDSPDGDYHWCSVSGKDDSSTICLFVPRNFVEKQRQFSLAQHSE